MHRSEFNGSHEILSYLCSLIRINTSNPPGNEGALVKYLESVFLREGLKYAIVEPAPGRANFVARYRGDGTRRPLLLSSHTDVVPAREEGWRHPPFEAAIEDDMVWGRGALDMKHACAMQMMVMFWLMRRKPHLKRDVIFAAVADEETGSDLGSRYLVHKCRELIDAEYVLTEVGGQSTVIGDKCFYPIQIAEKGFCWIKARFHGTGGPWVASHGERSKSASGSGGGSREA